MGVLVVAAVILLLVAGALDLVRGRRPNASPPYDVDRYEATERFRNNLPPSI